VLECCAGSIAPRQGLQVYDGTDEYAPQLASLTGTSLPPTLVALSGSLFLLFTTDGGISASGFRAAYAAARPPALVGPATSPPPTVAPTSSPTIAPTKSAAPTSAPTASGAPCAQRYGAVLELSAGNGTIGSVRTSPLRARAGAVRRLRARVRVPRRAAPRSAASTRTWHASATR
jgi:hypothetical protein